MDVPVDIPDKLNVGCGQDVRVGFYNVDRNIEGAIPFGVFPLDVDRGQLLELPHDYFDRILALGCLAEFKTDLVEIMNQFWTLLRHNGRLEISVAVVDGGNLTPFEDPLARRYMASRWIEFFHVDGDMADYPLGFRGRFRLILNEISDLGVQRCTLFAVKTAA